MYVRCRKLFLNIGNSVLTHLQFLKTIANVKESSSPLDGIKILDLTRIAAGPYCTMILGDMGAEIFKIERPGTGDETRKWGPPFIGNSAESTYFICLNRNKKSVCVDLKSDLGRKLIYELASKCDVLVENYIPGKLEQLQLGYEDIKKVAPHLIYCSITGYGPVGPYRNKPGYDVIASSVGGLINITGSENGGPTKPGVAVTDLASGLYAHGAILAALIKRGCSGLGQKIDCNLLSTQIASLINIGSDYLSAGKEAKRWGTAHPSIVPYQAFVTKDGYFTVGTGSDNQFIDLCNKINIPDVALNKKYRTNKDRVLNRNDLIELLEPIFKLKSNNEWAVIFEDAQFPCGPVNTLKDVFNDPQVSALGLVQEIEHKYAGKIKVVGPPVIYSEGGNFIRLPPPALGEHTDEVLGNILGYTKDSIASLRNSKVIQ